MFITEYGWAPCTYDYSDVLASGSENFGLIDQKGRAMGFTWSVQRVTHTLLTEEQYNARQYGCGCHTPGEPLVQYRLSTSPTRNGKHYSAGGGGRFNTLEEAETVARKRAINARKRDAKKFAQFNV